MQDFRICSRQQPYTVRLGKWSSTNHKQPCLGPRPGLRDAPHLLDVLQELTSQGGLEVPPAKKTVSGSVERSACKRSGLKHLGAVYFEALLVMSEAFNA